MRLDLPKTVVVMGVCGCGKTEVGRAVAVLMGGVFEDADGFHTGAAKAKMGEGIPLTDEDRWPWLERLRQRIEQMRAEGKGYVLACSALRGVYREKLRGGDEAGVLRFVLLDGSRELIAERMGRRVGHYMPLSLLDSQLAILERSEDLMAVSVEPEVGVIASGIVERLMKEGVGDE
jgi:gluconokinase